MIKFGMRVTSQVALRCGQVFPGYDVAQLFGFRENKNEWADHKMLSARWMDGWMDLKLGL